MSIRVAINGFGRTGRAAFRAARGRDADIQWAGINDLMDQQTLTHLLAPRLGVRARFRAASRRPPTAIRVDGADIPVSAEIDPGALPVGRARSRRGDRVDRPLAPRARGRRHLEAGARKVIISAPAKGARRRRHRRSRRQLRPGLRPRRARHDLQRVVHDELPGARRQGAARGVRGPARRDDDDARLHRRPAAARLPAQGPAARPRRRAEHGSDHDRRGQRARPRDPRAGGPTGRVRGARAHADGLARGPHRRGGARPPRRKRSTPPSHERADTGPLAASSPTPRTRSSRPTSSPPPTRRSSTPA